jgi:hypothetical protein
MVFFTHPLVLYAVTRQALHVVLTHLHPHMSQPENWRMTSKFKQSRFAVKENESKLPKSQQQLSLKWLRKWTSFPWWAI